MVTTFTITSGDVPNGTTYSLVSKVIESKASAFQHLREMARTYPDIKPYRVTTSSGIRWSWEGWSSDGLRWSDTVRVVL